MRLKGYEVMRLKGGVSNYLDTLLYLSRSEVLLHKDFLACTVAITDDIET